MSEPWLALHTLRTSCCVGACPACLVSAVEWDAVSRRAEAGNAVLGRLNAPHRKPRIQNRRRDQMTLSAPSRASSSPRPARRHLTGRCHSRYRQRQPRSVGQTNRDSESAGLLAVHRAPGNMLNDVDVGSDGLGDEHIGAGRCSRGARRRARTVHVSRLRLCGETWGPSHDQATAAAHYAQSALTCFSPLQPAKSMHVTPKPARHARQSRWRRHRP